MVFSPKLIAFLATLDGSRSRPFYEGVLGLEFILEDDFALVFNAGGVELRIQKVSVLTPQPHTQLGWSVASLDEVVRALRERGASFEIYSFLDQDQNGIWISPTGAKIVWLKDPDGNLLSLTEPSPA
jgi:catechol 2,3-dioxygenase-like lactoylglutathione lyase family enzyme